MVTSARTTEASTRRRIRLSTRDFDTINDTLGFRRCHPWNSSTVSSEARQPVVKLQLHSAGDASPLTALLLHQIWPIFSVVAPCPRGASPASVRRWTFTT